MRLPSYCLVFVTIITTQNSIPSSAEPQPQPLLDYNDDRNQLIDEDQHISSAVERKMSAAAMSNASAVVARSVERLSTVRQKYAHAGSQRELVPQQQMQQAYAVTVSPSGSPAVTTPFLNPQERLYQRIITNHQISRPDLKDVPINVTVRIILIKLQDLIEKSELMETTVRIQIGWRDKRLAWNKTEYGMLGEILLPSATVWIPDLAIINSVSDVYSVVRDTRFEIKVESDGQLWWHPTGVLRTFCKLHLSYFPFDRQKCSIIVESPTFDRRFLNLRLRSERTPVDLRMYVESETWRLEKTFGTSQQIKAGVNTYFCRIEFWLIIERARLYHSINFILPCFILSAIQSLFFFLPATHPQRVGSTTVTMLSVMVFQSMVVQQLPKTSESVPLLSIYIDLVILVSATSVCASIFTALCSFNKDRKAPVPMWLQSCCTWRRSTCLFAAPPSAPPPRNKSPEAIPLATVEKPGESEAPVAMVAARSSKGSVGDDRIDELPLVKTAARPYRNPLLSSYPHPRTYSVPAPYHSPSAPRPASLRHLQGIIEEHPGARAARRYAHSVDEQQSREDRVRRISMQAEGFTVVQIPSPEDRVFSSCCSESEEMTIFPTQKVRRDSQGHKINEPLTWIDILHYINHVLGCACFLAISLGPAIIFGVIPAVVDHQDFPIPLGENFTILTNAQVRRN